MHIKTLFPVDPRKRVNSILYCFILFYTKSSHRIHDSDKRNSNICEYCSPHSCESASGKDEYENLFEAGVVDPAKVARVALENAASVAGMFLTTECVIVDHPEEHPAPAMPAGGMGGMM